MQQLDQIAESYVRLALALGEHDPSYVDAYFGPPEWKDDAKGVALPDIIAGACEARSSLDIRSEGPEARRLFLAKQLDALIACAEMRNGKRFTFDEESSAIYDVIAPSYPDSYYGDIVERLESVLPGKGELSERWEAFRSQFYVPADRLHNLFKAGVDVAQERTRKHITLPGSESFQIELVSGQVWGAYNWYKGGAHSLIQVNTDLPMTINRVIHLACHEGYPGHHVYNALLEEHMVRENKWMEFTIYPLFSPESLIAEGTAEYGVDLCFPQDERLQFERDVLYPMAGIDPGRAEELARVQELMDGLGNATNDAARRYIDGHATKEETVGWLQTYALASRKRAEQNVRFFDANRSYIVTYDVGKEMVKRHIESRADTAAERWQVFTGLLSSPTVPSDLK